jgi:hypothetical protein
MALGDRIITLANSLTRFPPEFSPWYSSFPEYLTTYTYSPHTADVLRVVIH